MVRSGPRHSVSRQQSGEMGVAGASGLLRDSGKNVNAAQIMGMEKNMMTSNDTVLQH